MCLSNLKSRLCRFEQKRNVTKKRDIHATCSGARMRRRTLPTVFCNEFLPCSSALSPQCMSMSRNSMGSTWVPRRNGVEVKSPQEIPRMELTCCNQALKDL